MESDYDEPILIDYDANRREDSKQVGIKLHEKFVEAISKYEMDNDSFMDVENARQIETYIKSIQNSTELNRGEDVDSKKLSSEDDSISKKIVNNKECECVLL